MRYPGEIALFVGTLLAAVGWFFSKFALADFPPVTFIALRFFMAGLLFLPFAWQGIRQFSRIQWGMAIAIGGCFTLNLMTWIFALNQSQALGEGAFVMSLSLLIAPLIAWLLFQHRPARPFWWALPCAISGLYCLTAGQGGQSFSAATGLFLCSALALAFYVALLNQFAKQIAPLPLTTILLLTVGISGSLYASMTETWSWTARWQGWGWLAASIVIATNLRFFIQTFGQRHCSMAAAAMIMLLEPVWTLLFSLWWLNEGLSWQKGLGCVLILMSLAIYRLPTWRVTWRR